MLKHYAIAAICATVLGACGNQSTEITDCDAGHAPDAGADAHVDCVADSDCDADICNVPSCVSGECVRAAMPDGTACGVAGICMFDGNCVCKGCVDIDGECQPGTDAEACGIAPPGPTSVACVCCPTDSVCGSAGICD